MIPMSDDKGNTIYIPFINGKPQLNIPPGFAIRAAAPKAEVPATDSTTPTAPAAQEQRGGGGGDRGTMGQRDSFDNASESDGEAGPDFGGMINSAAQAGLFGIPGVVAAKAYNALQTASTDPTSMFGPYGFGYATDSGPNARLAVVKQAIQLSLDQGIDPNDALSSIMSDSSLASAISGQDAANARDSVDTGVTVGPAISTPNTSPTTLGPATGGSGSQRGGESVGGYGTGSQAGAAAAAGTVGGYGPGTPGFGGGGGNAGASGGSTSGGSAAGASARGGMGFGGTGSGVGGSD
jgi:hypothetical protein